MVRLKDIAARAGVSVMTVSKVLRDAPDISPATKTRIRKLAREMDYLPDSMAQSLRNRTSKLLGVVVSSSTNPVFARMLLAIEERSHKLGYDLMLAHTLNDPQREEDAIRRLLSRRVDGLLITPVYRLAPVAPIYEELARRDIPTVLLGQRADFCNQFVSVQSDDLQGSYLVTRHLLELGHRRIAFFCGPPGTPWAQERFDGYRRALREWQLDVDERLVFNAGATIEAGQHAAEQMLRESPGATAVQMVTDLVAIGAANVFLNRGLQIPEDLSLAGFGNILLSEHGRVPLTTVREPKFRLGCAAMDEMARMLLGKPAQPQCLPAELAIRASTGPPTRRHHGQATTDHGPPCRDPVGRSAAL